MEIYFACIQLQLNQGLLEHFLRIRQMEGHCDHLSLESGLVIMKYNAKHENKQKSLVNASSSMLKETNTRTDDDLDNELCLNR